MKNRIACYLVISIVSLGALACGNGTKETPPSNTTAPGASAGSPTPLAPSAYKVEWLRTQIPSVMPASKEQVISVTVKNTGEGTWPSIGVGGGPVNMVLVTYHWLPAQGEKAIVWEGVRTALPKDIAPGESFTLDKVHVLAPKDPGSYRLQMTLVQEGVSWFEGRGPNGLIIPVTVQ